jgi:hypothetical protein
MDQKKINIEKFFTILNAKLKSIMDEKLEFCEKKTAYLIVILYNYLFSQVHVDDIRFFDYLEMARIDKNSLYRQKLIPIDLLDKDIDTYDKVFLEVLIREEIDDLIASVQ